MDLFKKSLTKKNNHQSYNFGGYEFKLNSLQKKSNKCFFSGYASVFHIIDNQNDIILPGAFQKSISETKKIILLWQHNHSEPIGKVTSLKEDQNGLQIEGELILEISKAGDVYHMLKHGILDSFSIGYTPLKFSYKNNQNDHSEIRLIKELKLWEISLVTFPANSFAKINNINYQSDNFKNDFDSHDEFNYDELCKYVFENESDSFSGQKQEDILASKRIKEMIEKFHS